MYLKIKGHTFEKEGKFANYICGINMVVLNLPEPAFPISKAIKYILGKVRIYVRFNLQKNNSKSSMSSADFYSQ